MQVFSLSELNTYRVLLPSKLNNETYYKLITDISNKLKDCKLVILDCENLEEIDGTGFLLLSIILGHLDRCCANIIVKNLKEQPLRLFKFFKLDKIYNNTEGSRFRKLISIKIANIVKRFIDIILSCIILSIFFIPCIIIYFSILLTSPGNPIYTQKRMKRHNTKEYDLYSLNEKDTFNMYKFRTMCINAEQNGAVNAERNDSRVTKLGRWLRKTRLDELPNFINVIKGEMSIVGPRADRPEILEKSKKNFPLIYERTRYVKPGITGWAQSDLLSNGELGSLTHPLVNVIPTKEIEMNVDSFRFKQYYEAAYSLLMSNLFSFLKLEMFLIFKTPFIMFFKKNVI